MKNIRFLPLLIILIYFAGCATTTTVQRVSVDTPKELTGNWNDTDSRMVAQDMIKDMLFRPWLADFISENDRKPVVIVGHVKNKTSEHINTDTFINDIERELINSGKVKFVAANKERLQILEERYYQQSHASDETAKSLAQETGADFMLLGSISSMNDASGGKEIKYYQIDLSLVNIETNEKVWIGSKKIKRFIKRAKYDW
jgi:uncharacterized protein (TIGR02722 family)